MNVVQLGPVCQAGSQGLWQHASCVGSVTGVVRHEHDDLHAPHVGPVDGLHVVAHRCEPGPHEVVERTLETQPVGDLTVPEPRHVGGRLRVGAEVEQIHQELGMTLCLHVPAHQRHGHDRRFVPQQKTCR